MIAFNVVDRQDVSTSITNNIGVSLMEAIRNNGLDQLLALCGGCGSCATCHVYVIGPEQNSLSKDEGDLLDSCSHRTAMSRLSCQVLLTEEHKGLTINISPTEWGTGHD